MKTLFLQEILKQTGGTIIQGSGNPLIQSVTYRPKKISDHTLLFHRYKDMSLKKKLFQKYKSVVVMTDVPEMFQNLSSSVMIVKVNEVEEVYWKFVNYYRGIFSIPVIGITGTCGKTTTKEMVKHILRKYHKVHSTFLSNNQRSLNLKYLLGMDDETEAAVFEMPVASPGYLTNTIHYFQPNIRILLNIDVYHLRDSKTPEAYMKAKAEIINGLNRETGIIIINNDDENIRKVLDVTEFKQVIRFGIDKKCDFQAKKIQYEKDGMTFTLFYKNQSYPVYVPGYGKGNVYNSLAAIAAASSTGMEIRECCERLASFRQMKEHLQFHNGRGGCTVIDDTWNAAPLSMAASLDVLKETAETKKKVAILGYMPQLGDSSYAKEQYVKMGEKAAASKLDLLFVVGEQAKEIGNKAIALGMNPKNVHFVSTGTEIYQILRPLLTRDTAILFKIPHRVMIQDSFKELKKKLLNTT
ncbi:Mur ligase family protein [Bacillus taeanensis]|uniref:UDP-N-acetylmuramoyl-tripeptide--D-alanyl-D-alanine ligase n=1 Tax=Bacillus taeanensis TaxID=273032 RepID=A0A366XUV5_9BACI|nr:Mur ligase family protein [Bacillus taeanensis]RBW69446.1 UDP-N-acetylmuramoyl-tripeptide--D-alanyl-D-alanine ligase [Bacillus taeanensis]